MAREFGEENLFIATLPIMESVVRGQFPKASLITLPIRKKRVILNVFVANFLRCFSPWMSLMKTKVDVSISLRHMRDYLQSILFYSVRSQRRFIAENLLLGNGRPVRRWTECAFKRLFDSQMISYPEAGEGVPSELEVNRKLASAVLGREVGISEIWPELKPVGPPPLEPPYWICAPFSSDPGKDFPLERWIGLFDSMQRSGRLPTLVLTGSSEQSEKLKSFLGLWNEFPSETHVDSRVIISSTIQDFVDLLAGAQCVLTVDTAAAHAATALDLKTMVLFSGLHQGMFAPWVRSTRQHWMVQEKSSDLQPWHAAHKDSDLVRVMEELFPG